MNNNERYVAMMNRIELNEEESSHESSMMINTNFNTSRRCIKLTKTAQGVYELICLN